MVQCSCLLLCFPPNKGYILISGLPQSIVQRLDSFNVRKFQAKSHSLYYTLYRSAAMQWRLPGATFTWIDRPVAIQWPPRVRGTDAWTIIDVTVAATHPRMLQFHHFHGATFCCDQSRRAETFAQSHICTVATVAATTDSIQTCLIRATGLHIISRQTIHKSYMIVGCTACTILSV